MKHQLRFMALHAVLAGSILAQSNTVAGLDGNLHDVNDPRVWGRQGPAYPNGEIGFSAANYICNSGSVTIPFMAAMNPDHPNFAFMITRLSNGLAVRVGMTGCL